MTAIHLTFKRKFLAGLIITVPAVFTVLVIIYLFRFIDGILGPWFEIFSGRHIAGLGFITAMLVVFLVGIISTNVVGKKILAQVEKIFLHIPVFKGIYTALKQLVDAFSPENNTSFKKFVIVEYPGPGLHVFGFLTKQCRITSISSDKNLIAVYIPTNNLYLGEIVLVEENRVIHTEISIEDGIKIILSGGISTPSLIKGKQELTS